MNNSEDQFPLEIYLNQIQKIHDIRFTPRQIDIMACILHGRKTSKIAEILSISTKTIEAHIGIIIEKIAGKRGGSRELIIDFIEKSDKYQNMKAYYFALLIQHDFEKKLQVISKWVSPKGFSCTLHYGKEHEKSSLLIQLKKDLSLAGLKIRLMRDANNLSDAPIVSWNTSSLLHEEKENTITFEGKKDYYPKFFEFLKKLVPDHEVGKVLSDFLSFTDIIKTNLDSQTQSPYYDIKIPSLKPAVNLVTNRLFFYKYFILFSIIITLFGTGIISYHSLKNSQVTTIARSDLIIPTEKTLLIRPKLLAEIDKKLSNQTGIQSVALVGIGGAGKTTLARQYARSQKAPIIWEINAESSDSRKNSLEDFANALSKSNEEINKLKIIHEIKDEKYREKKILNLIKEKLKQQSTWILIFDNVDKFADIKNYWPSDPAVWGFGKVIITTRDAHIQKNNQVKASLTIQDLTSIEKSDLFTKIIDNETIKRLNDEHKNERESFLKELPPYPLDISVAAYYLKETQISYDEYLKNLVRNDSIFTATQENMLMEATDYTNSRYQIIATSLKHMIDSHKDFADLFLFISLLDSQNIPKDLLKARKDKLVVDSFIYNLKKYSLITNESSLNNLGTFFSIHRSTQEICLDHLIKKFNLKHNKETINNISANYEKYLEDIIEEKNISKMNLSMTHCERFLSHDDLLNDTNVKGFIYSILGRMNYYLGQHVKAKQFLENSLTELNKDKKGNNFRIALVLTYLGSILRFNGNYEQSKELLDQSLSIYKMEYPKKYDKISWVLTCMSKLYLDLGNYEKAKNLLEEAIDIYKQHPPKNKHDLAWALGCLGNSYREMGDYEKAKYYLEESLVLYKNYFSEDNASFAWALINLGEFHRKLGNYEKAREFSERGLNYFKEHFSDENIRTAWASTYLGYIYADLGKHEKTIDLVEHSLIIYKKHFFDNHVLIGWNLTILGNAYGALGQYQKSKNLLEQSLAIYREHYSENSIEIARLLNDLGRIHFLEGKLDKAEELFLKSLDILQKNNYPEKYTVLENLSDLYLKKALLISNTQDQTTLRDQTQSSLQQAYDIVRAHFPADSPHLARIQGKLKNLKHQ